MKTDYKVITTLQELETTAEHLEKEETVGVDLEADSMFHYQEKVCLLQLATPRICFLVDPLQTGSLLPLKPFFSNPDIRKIFHGSDYDIRCLFRDFAIEVENLFDSQLACRFLGMKLTGLAALVNLFFDIKLEKKFQKKDWSQRPLPLNMLEYAAQDVIYLNKLSSILEERLIETGRRDWFLEECSILSRVRAQASNGSPHYLKVKGASRLGRRSLAVLEAMLEFRNSIAEKMDKPLYRVFHNNILMKMAIEKPRFMDHLKRLEVLGNKQLDRYGRKLLDIINHVMELDPSALPVYQEERRRGQGMNAKTSARIAALKKWRESAAIQLEIEPGLLCNNSLLKAISEKNPVNREELYSIDGIKPWQIEAAGSQIIAILQEERFLRL